MTFFDQSKKPSRDAIISQMAKDKACYNVSLKVLIEKDGKFLMLTNNEGILDLPGGRVDADEHKEPLRQTLLREIAEELGEDIKVEIGEPVMCFRRIFDDYDIDVFLVVFSGKTISGDISISDEHNDYFWMSPQEVIADQNKFYSGEEYEAFKKFLLNRGL